jgi:predicted DNA-binding transcriptional regulator YafY
MTNQTARVLELLKRFNNNNIVCIKELQKEYLWQTADNKPMSEKTIRRDLNIIKAIFPESFELVRGGEKGCYKAITKQAFNNFMNPNNISLMVQTFNMAQRNNLFESLEIDKADKSIIESKVNDLKKIYEFKNKPFENKPNDFELFKKLESAVYHQKHIIIDYEVLGKIEKIEVKPYKIVFMNENFYLACEVNHTDYSFSPFRISKIHSVFDTTKTFHKDFDIEEFILSIQTPFSKYTKNFRQNLIDVILEVDSLKTGYFRAKKYLSSQKILETKENGNLLIKFTVTQELELEELIKKWIPYVKVIEPVSLKDKINSILIKYLNH